MKRVCSLYLYGGYQLELGILDDFQRMKVTENNDIYQWENVEAVSQEGHPGPRAWHTMVLHKGCIYIYGGQVNSISSTNRINCFDVEKKTWAEVDCHSEEKPIPISQHSADIWQKSDTESQMVVFGGFSQAAKNYGCSNQIYLYDFAQQKWSTAPAKAGPKPAPRYSSSLTIIKDKAYVFGGNARPTRPLATRPPATPIEDVLAVACHL